MSDEREMERLLEQVSVPNLRKGSHREQLKTELLDPMVRSKRKGEDPINANGRFRMTRLMKLAAGVLIAVSLVATGWAAEKVYQKIMKKSYYVELETSSSPSVKLPDGPDGPHSMVSFSTTGTTIPEDSPAGSTEKVKRHHELMKQLIAEKKYKFIRTFEYPPGSETQYVYGFTFPAGDNLHMNFTMPLEDVTSWEDYLQKRKEQQRQRNEKISKAIAAGKFRLLDVEPLVIHVCTEADSEQKLLVQCIGLPDGKEIALVRGEAASVPVYQTSWQDHLQLVRQGERVLLGLQIVERYTYEITLDDGSTAIFNYNGNEPIKKPQG